MCVRERERERSENEVIKNANTLTTTYYRCSISKFKEVRQIWKKEKKKKERKEWRLVDSFTKYKVVTIAKNKIKKVR